MRTRLIACLAAAGLTLLIGACSTGATSRPQVGDTVAPAPIETGTSVARATSDTVAVFDTPDPTASVTEVAGTSDFGFRRAFLVLGEDGEFLEVLLPERPNGSTGWVRASDIEVEQVTHEVQVDLEARTLRWFENGNVVLETPVAIGALDYPTPTGQFFVTDLLDTGESGGAYGPYAIGLSGYSNVLTEFGGGDGQIGIHGTNDPSTIGQDVSHGCVRVPNDVIARLATELSIGTPVLVT
jgi:lipoprotein-anchoring transpeptidase ErfK/SrfK